MDFISRYSLVWTQQKRLKLNTKRKIQINNMHHRASSITDPYGEVRREELTISASPAVHIIPVE